MIRGKLSDVSLGGCFVEMPIPLAVKSRFEIALWLGDTKLRVKGEVVSTSPGYGIGVRFVSLSPEDQELLRRHVQTLTKTTRPRIG